MRRSWVRNSERQGALCSSGPAGPRRRRLSGGRPIPLRRLVFTLLEEAKGVGGAEGRDGAQKCDPRCENTGDGSTRQPSVIRRSTSSANRKPSKDAGAYRFLLRTVYLNPLTHPTLGSAQESVKGSNWRGFEDPGNFGVRLPIFPLIEVLVWRACAGTVLPGAGLLAGNVAARGRHGAINASASH